MQRDLIVRNACPVAIPGNCRERKVPMRWRKMVSFWLQRGSPRGQKFLTHFHFDRRICILNAF